MHVLSPRITGAALVAALHALVIAGFLAMKLVPDVVHPGIAPEALIALPPITAKPLSAPQQGPAQSGLSSATVSSDLKLPFAMPQAMAPSLGLPLFACAPENLKNLARDERDRCLKLASARYDKMKDGLPVYVKPPGPEWADLRNSDIRARERNTADPCMAAKATGTDCIHEVLYGKRLW